MRLLGTVFICAAVLGGFLSCVSRSLTEERFSESKALAAPVNNVVVGDPEQFSFSFVGDMHIAGADVAYLGEILEDSSARGDAFHLSLGDIVDEGHESDYQAFVDTVAAKGWTGKLFPVVGNHDVFHEGWKYYKQFFGPSHYSFTVGNAKFIVFDTADGNVGEEQMAWIESELSGTLPTHVFLVSHYLPVIPGVQTYLRLANREEALSLMRLASTKNVAAWIGGHYHSFVSETIDGVQYVVAGGGGGRRMPPIKEYFYVRAEISGSSINFGRHKID